MYYVLPVAADVLNGWFCVCACKLPASYTILNM